MTPLYTTRLKIVPLTLNQLHDLLNNVQPKNIDFQLTTLDEDTHIAMQGLYNDCIKNQEQWYWFTNWQIVLLQENKAIGSCCFVHPPDNEGMVEIGYGIDVPFRNQEYMTEAAQALCEWALQQNNVKGVTAQTEKWNTASHRVLEKCGMNCFLETDEGLFWIINKKQ